MRDSIGTFGGGRDVGVEAQANGRVIVALGQLRYRDGTCRQCAGSAQMAALAIDMGKTETLAIFARRQVWPVTALVAVLMVAKMRSGCCAVLMTAIARGGTPDELELHEKQQKDNEPTSHGGEF